MNDITAPHYSFCPMSHWKFEPGLPGMLPPLAARLVAEHLFAAIVERPEVREFVRTCREAPGADALAKDLGGATALEAKVRGLAERVDAAWEREGLVRPARAKTGADALGTCGRLACTCQWLFAGLQAPVVHLMLAVHRATDRPVRPLAATVCINFVGEPLSLAALDHLVRRAAGTADDALLADCRPFVGRVAEWRAAVTDRPDLHNISFLAAGTYRDRGLDTMVHNIRLCSGWDDPARWTLTNLHWPPHFAGVLVAARLMAPLRTWPGQFLLLQAAEQLRAEKLQADQLPATPYQFRMTDQLPSAVRPAQRCTYMINAMECPFGDVRAVLRAIVRCGHTVQSVSVIASHDSHVPSSFFACQ